VKEQWKSKVLNNIKTEELVDLITAITKIPSVNPPGNELGIASYLMEVAKRVGLPAELQMVEKDRPNFIIRLPGLNEGPVLLLTAHMDTVSEGEHANWRYDPFGAVCEGNRIYGRGAADNKGGVTIILAAAIALHLAKVPLRNPLTIAAVMGEETGNVGMRYLIENGERVDRAIVTEWTGANKVGLGYRGSLWLKIKTAGITAHGSRPHQGINAIDTMTEVVLPELKRIINGFKNEINPLFIVPETTINVGAIKGGLATNVVPDYCEAFVDIRLLPGQDPREIFKIINNHFANLEAAKPDLHVSFEQVGSNFPFLITKEEDLIKSISSNISKITGGEPEYFGKSGFSDANVLVEKLGIPVAVYGPGNSTGHQPNEYIEIKDLVASAKVLALTCVDICG